MTPFARRLAAGAALGVMAAGIVLGLDAALEAGARQGTANPLRTLELKTYDWRMKRTARPETARQDIALIEIDEYSLRNLEPVAGNWPWPRVVHSSLLGYLARAPARIIAYDVLFAAADRRDGFEWEGIRWSGARSDAALGNAIAKAGNVVLLADATYEGTSTAPFAAPDAGFQLTNPDVVERQVVFPPFPELAASAAALGHNLFVLDSDGPMRHVIPFVRSAGRTLPSLGVAAALRLGSIAPGDVRMTRDAVIFGDRSMPVQRRHVRTAEGRTAYAWAPINFRGPARLDDMQRRTYPTYSFFDLLLAEEQIRMGEKPDVDPSVFRDTLVFVGVSAAGLFDVFETPFGGARMPGIQVHAAVADDILSNRFLTPAGGGVRAASVVVSAVLAAIVSTAIPAWWAAVAVLLGAGGVVIGSSALFAGGLWIDLTQPLLAAGLALFCGVAYQYAVEGREKRKMKRLFGQYVSRDVYEQLVAHPELARLGGQRRDMTVLFSDIRGFTTFTESGQAEEIVALLNDYFTAMVELVFRHHGTLDKFVGDMVMALFGAPLDDEDHADHAVETALEMARTLDRLNERWMGEGRPRLEIGIGINSGSMIAGNIGSSAIMSYTVIGDAVNLGARLESLNKQYGTRILISDETRRRLKGRFPLRALGDVVVKGKTQSVAIYEVVATETGAERGLA